MKVLDMIFSTGIISWLILLIFIVGVVVIIKKYLEIKNNKVGAASFSIRMRGILKKKDIASAINYCSEEKSPLANIIKRGLKKYKFGRKRVVEAIESSSRNEIKKLERGLSLIATLASGAPMLGFLGTIVGVMITFYRLENMAQNLNQVIISRGIWQSLIPGAFGILASIPLVAFYNYFISAINRSIHELEMMAVDILDVLDSSDSEFAEDENEDEE